MVGKQDAIVVRLALFTFNNARFTSPLLRERAG
jgi:hypothetical protein